MTMTEPRGVERAALETKRGLVAVRRSYAVDGCEIRAASDPESNYVHFTGHASTYDKGYDMYGGPDKGGWTEYVDAGAGKKTLSEKPDVAFLLNHGGLTLARTKAGTLSLSEDKTGLAVDAPQLDKRVSAVNDMAILMDQGNLDEMSFAFRVMKQQWLDGDGAEVPWWDMTGIERHITEYSLHKGDVSVVNYGANPHTDGGLRSLPSFRDLVGAMTELRAGATLSAATKAALQEILDTVAAADESIDDAQDALSTLLGVPNPDPEMMAAVAATALEGQRRAFMARHAL